MLNQTQTRHLVIALGSSLLVACGGGGGGGPAALTAVPVPVIPAVSLAIPTLAKYEGVWRQDCIAHIRLTTTLTATSGDTFTTTPKEEHFANADCTGDVVATGSYGGPQETVQYAPEVVNASVRMINGDLITADVNPATSTLAVANFTFTGSGVRSSSDIRDVTTNRVTGTLTFIEYPDRTVAPITRLSVDGSTLQGGLLLRNDELFALVPIAPSTTAFQVNRSYVR